MRKLDSILVITIVAAVAASSYSALAKGGKSTSSLPKNTATVNHYDKTTLTPHKPKTPVTKQKASIKSGNTGKGPDNNPNSTGAGTANDKAMFLKFEFKSVGQVSGTSVDPPPPPPPPPPPK